MGDSCGMNMIGEIPQGVKLEEAYTSHGKRNRPPQDLPLNTNISKLSLQETGALP